MALGFGLRASSKVVRRALTRRMIRASFAAALAMDSITDRAPTERAERACEDWKRIVRAKCLEALKLEDNDPELRKIRAQRLAAWRNLSLASAAEAIGEIASRR